MELFIRIVDGQPIEHPILGDNFRQAFPDIDTENLPPNFAKFVRVDVPDMGPYEIHEGSQYGWKDGVITDIHQIREMTEEEKIEKQNKIKLEWLNSNGFKSWIFNEEICEYQPPVPKPNDGNLYYWNERDVKWEIFDPEKKD